jgi:hypothetical protein
MTVAEEALLQGPGDSGAGHHDDRGGGGLGRQRSATRPRTPLEGEEITYGFYSRGMNRRGQGLPFFIL